MKAPKISHTVVLEKPESAQANAARASLNPGFASCSGLKKTQGDSTVTTVTPMRPIAPPGSGSNMRPTMTPAKIAKKYQACCGSPAGVGVSAGTAAPAPGAMAFQGIFMTPSAGEMLAKRRDGADGTKVQLFPLLLPVQCEELRMEGMAKPWATVTAT